ncbi:Activator of stress protein 1 [Fusarium oxysporum f. sp. albedinis]|nr:Activator of stress protein 1 [Fusarium oxysporum f. sp. albedinis]
MGCHGSGELPRWPIPHESDSSARNKLSPASHIPQRHLKVMHTARVIILPHLQWSRMFPHVNETAMRAEISYVSEMICNHHRNKDQETQTVAGDHADYYLKLGPSHASPALVPFINQIHLINQPGPRAIRPNFHFGSAQLNEKFAWLHAEFRCVTVLLSNAAMESFEGSFAKGHRFWNKRYFIHLGPAMLLKDQLPSSSVSQVPQIFTF